MKVISGLLFATLLSLGLGVAACGGDDSSGDNSTTMSSQTCQSTHECINDVCECSTSGKKGNSCQKDDCEKDCEVCS